MPEQRVMVGQRLRAMRLSRGDSAEAVARLLGVSQPLVSMWERGARRPTVEYAEQLADYLGVDLTEMLHLIHAEHTGRTEVDDTMTNRLVELEATVETLIKKLEGLPKSRRKDL